ncbi:MAG TPA: DNA-processing protein DprA [Burkholderiaceae bacterium]|nr:DNA-processing protein DprA [Burkholderiaceae bacterium]
MLEDAELFAWLRLLAVPGLGRQNARRLLATFGGPEQVFDATTAALREVVAVPLAEALALPSEGWAAQREATRRWLDGEGRSIVPLGHPEYPPQLLQTPDPPLLLYLQGRQELLHARSIAIVGSRQATPQGVANARAFASHFSSAGLAVVSGLALGIDGAAHEGGLEGPGSTIAVVATGLDRVYPKRHLALAHRIAVHGLLISELPLDTPPLRQNFPSRNRIIAGLALGTLVVEAAPDSGSLITARQAVEMGREIFAIPGSIHAPQSRGCHWLIKQGAKLVDRAEDVLEELRLAEPRLAAASTETARGPDNKDPVLSALGHDPVTLDALVARTGWPADQLNVRLLELELEGQLVRLPGGLFQRRVAV